MPDPAIPYPHLRPDRPVCLLSGPNYPRLDLEATDTPEKRHAASEGVR